MERIQAADALFLDTERVASPSLIGCLIILDPATAPGSFVRHRDILQYVEERLHLAPHLRKRLVQHPLRLDEPRLVDDANFDLEFHVRHLALPRPRDRRQLNILASRLMSRPVDMERPLWELYIIEGLEEIPEYPKDSFAMMMKLHHAGFDGAAAGAAIWAMMQDTADARPQPPEFPWRPERAPGPYDWTASSVQEALKQLMSNASALPNLSQNVVRGALATASDPNVGRAAPKTRFQQPLTSHRVFDWKVFPLSEMQALRAALGKPKMNDLMLCLIAGALRRYLGAKGELPKDTLIAMCPINARGAGDPSEGGNKVTAMRVPLGTHIKDPMERLTFIAEASKQGKGVAEAWGGDIMGATLAFYPYMARSAVMRGLTRLAAGADLPAFANTIVTNIPNPKGGHYFAGSKVLAYAGFGPPTDGLGIFHTVTGMDWEVSLSVTSCREIMPDIAAYIACAVESYEELRAVAGLGLSQAAEPSAVAPKVRPARSAAVRAKRRTNPAAPQLDA